MNETVLIETFGIVLLCFALVAFGWSIWRQWQRTPPGPGRTELVENAVRRLVEAAEQLYPQSGSGQARYGWVMNRLTRRFPDVDWDELTEYIEAAVHHLRGSRAARQAGHRHVPQGVPTGEYPTHRAED